MRARDPCILTLCFAQHVFDNMCLIWRAKCSQFCQALQQRIYRGTDFILLVRAVTESWVHLLKLRPIVLHLTIKPTINTLQCRPRISFHLQRSAALVCFPNRGQLRKASQPTVSRRKMTTASRKENFHHVPDATPIVDTSDSRGSPISPSHTSTNRLCKEHTAFVTGRRLQEGMQSSGESVVSIKSLLRS